MLDLFIINSIDMKRKSLYLSIFITIIALFFIHGCQKESSNKEALPDNTETIEKNAVLALNTVDELNLFAASGFNVNTLKALDLTLGSCPLISINLTQQPFTIALDWGSGCKNSDGITRSGKILMTLTGMMNVAGSQATFKFVDYVSDGKKISGVHRFTYKGLNELNNWPRYAVLSEIKIEYPDLSVITFRAETFHLQSAGTTTATPLDDTWRTEGSATGVGKDKMTWSAKTTKALVKKGDCNYISSGTLAITPLTGAVRTLDFGAESCDNKATLTVEDKTTTITL